MVDDRIAKVVAGATGLAVTRLAPLHGGDTSRAARADLADGTSRFVKWAGPWAASFEREAADLVWLDEAGAVPVAEVVTARDDHDAEAPAHLVLGWIEPGRPRAGTEARFGAALAALHRSGAPAHGRSDRRRTGSLGLPNEPVGSWAAHLAANRFEPLARIARQRDALPGDVVDRLSRLAGRLDDEVLGTTEAPARLHGDLWAGNRLVDADGASWLIDPAAHGGNREWDLAMMRLFGGFGDEVFAAYGTEHPLADGWADRVALHQLAPLVVHAVKFSGAYVTAAERALAAAEALV